MTKYRKSFYQSLEAQALTSAKEILPFVRELTNFKSVIDIGCGTGEWLSVCQELGANEILGVDFHEGDLLNIPKASYLQHDLTAPLSLTKQFDLALSLEVAQHIEPESARVLVQTLTSVAPVVLFSSAIPLQGGTHHVNEQWPDYWASLFEKFDFIAHDLVRPRFWDNSNVTCYYAQNMVLYARREITFAPAPSFELRKFVHPGLFADQAKELRQLRPLFTSRGLVKRLPGALWLSVADRVKIALDR